MKLEEKNGIAYLEGQRVFPIEPNDISWRMRGGWLEDIQNGHDVFLQPIIPYFEREAISRLEKELCTFKTDAPDIRDGYEDWRLYWLNEALQNCQTHSPISEAGEHLSQVGKAAVNVLMTCSALRHALEANKAREAAALSMLLICEVFAGGPSIKYEATQMEIEEIKTAIQKEYWRRS